MTTQPVPATLPTGDGVSIMGPEFRSPFWQWAGITAKKVGEGLVELSMSIRPEMINVGNGSLHGGMTAALIDSAVAAVIATVYKQGADIKGMTTTDLHVTYLEAVRPSSQLTCRCRLVRKGGTLCVGEAEVRDQDDRLCAVGLATYMVFRNRAPQNPS